MTSLWQSVLRTRRVPRLGTLTASPDRATPSYRRFGKSANSPRVCASRCLSTQSVAHSPLRGRSNTSRLLGPTPSCRTESHCASPRAASCCMSFACTPAPVNGRLPGVNAALASMLPNLACRCNFGLQLRCQLTRVIATTPTRTRARSQSRAPPRGVKPTCAPSKPLSSWRLEPPSMVRNGRLCLILISSSKPRLVTSSPTPLQRLSHATRS